MSKLRIRLLERIAQQQGAQTTQTAQPTTQSTSVPPPPAVPAIVFAHLQEGYNGPTLQLIAQLTQQLNSALHYASNGKDSFQQIIDNNLDLSGAAPDEKNVGGLSKRVYSTFLNSRNPFPSKVPAKNIHTWAGNIINSPEYNNLSQINPTGTLATKLQGNLKSTILDYMNQIKQQNPLTQ